MSAYVLPTNYEIFQVMQDLAAPKLARCELLKRVPARYSGNAEVRWEQYDKYWGIMSARGVNGAPATITPLGSSRFKMKPGYYGNVRVWDETQLTQLREIGTPNQPLDMRGEMAREQARMLGMRLDLMEDTISTLFRTGKVLHTLADGTVIHTDNISIPAAFTVSTPWATTATATPLADLRGWKVTAQTGTDSSFGADSEILMNQQTLTYLLNNSNSADLGGKRVEFGKSVLSLDDINTILAANDIGKIVVYDRQKVPTAGTFTRLIPNGEAIWLGARPAGESVAEFVLTFNSQEDDMLQDGSFPDGNSTGRSGVYTRVIDKGLLTVPRTLELHHGMNGGVAVYYPSAIRPINAN